ncbi:MAG TPA: uracil-DNA glycosylase family protein [Paraburkholderia sp.]|nr:uracil-DNA glycosylase family protein [Paraburkholderia sp.]
MALYESALEELGLAPLWVRRGHAAAPVAEMPGQRMERAADGRPEGEADGGAVQAAADPARHAAAVPRARGDAAALAAHGERGGGAADGSQAPARRPGVREAGLREGSHEGLHEGLRADDVDEHAHRPGATRATPAAYAREPEMRRAASEPATPAADEREQAMRRATPEPAIPAADAREPSARRAAPPQATPAPDTRNPAPHRAAPAEPAPVDEDMSWFDDTPFEPSARAARPAAAQPSAYAADEAGAAPDDTVALPPIATLDWDALAARVAGCERCRLCEKRTNTVFGVGDRAADWMLIGEAPGENEDRQGEPFVGQAGKLLDNMLRSLSLTRGTNVYIANVIKCRPPGNRNPEPDEVARCEPYLQRQVALVRPKLIVALGRFAAQSLLKTEASISSLRGRVHEYEGVPVIVTYHPAYLLRSLHDKAKSWQDLCLARDTWRNGSHARAADSRGDGAPL